VEEGIVLNTETVRVLREEISALEQKISAIRVVLGDDARPAKAAPARATRKNASSPAADPVKPAGKDQAAQVVAVFDNAEETLTITEIGERTGFDKFQARNACARAKKAGLIRSVSYGKYRKVANP